MYKRDKNKFKNTWIVYDCIQLTNGNSVVAFYNYILIFDDKSNE